METKNTKVYRAFLSTVSILLITLIVLLIVCLILTTSRLFADNPLAGSASKYIDLLENWTYADDNTELRYSRYQTASIVRLSDDGTVEIQSTLQQNVPGSFVLFFRADCPDVDVFCNDSMIFSFHSTGELNTDKDMFREFFVHNSSWEQGDRVKIRLHSQITDRIYFQFPCLGTENGIRVHIFHACQGAFLTSILAVLAMLVGVVVFFYHLAHGANHPDLLLLVLFSVLSGFWMLTDSGLAILIFRYNVVLYFINYSLPMLLTVTYLLLIPTAVNKRLTGYTPMALSCLVILLLSYVIHKFEIATLRQMMSIFSAVMLAVFTCSTIVALRSLSREHRYFKINSVMILAVTLATVLHYLFNKKMQSTMLFRHALIVFMFVMLTVLLRGIHRMERQAKVSARLQQEKEQAEAKMLLSQINSHFFYNTINTIRGLILSDADCAYKITGDFGKYVRYRVNSASDDAHFSTFKEELRAIRAYADICAVRMNRNLQMKYEIEDDRFLIPMLTVEPIVENAIKHGIYEGSGEGTVTVRTERDGSFWKVTVKDNGCGFDPKKTDDQKGVGIANIRTRLSRYPGCSLFIESQPGEGTTVTIRYPDTFGGAEDETDSC